MCLSFSRSLLVSGVPDASSAVTASSLLQFFFLFFCVCVFLRRGRRLVKCRHDHDNDHDRVAIIAGGSHSVPQERRVKTKEDFWQNSDSAGTCTLPRSLGIFQG